MSLLEWLNPIGQVASGIGSLFSAGFNAFSQSQTNKLNERLTRENWARQDTAYQRQVADLRKAGLNKALAYGSGGASTSQPLAMSAPQLDTGSIAHGFSALGSGATGLTKEARKLVREQYNFDREKLGLTLESMANANSLQRVQEQIAQAKLSMQNMLNQFMAGELNLIDWDIEKRIATKDYETRKTLAELNNVNANSDYLKSKVNSQAFEKVAGERITIDGKHYTLTELLARLIKLQYSVSIKDGEYTQEVLEQSLNWMSADKFIDTLSKIFGSGAQMADIVTAFDRMNQEHKSKSSVTQEYGRNGELLSTIITNSMKE